MVAPREVFDEGAGAAAEAAVEEYVLAAIGGGKTSEEAYAVVELSLQRRKLRALGSSLLKFDRLKSLDLSRNKLDTVDDIVCAPFSAILERLSLYYNAIKDPGEVALLARLPKLKSLDLRLNPVTRSKIYRLFVLNIPYHYAT